MKVLLFTLEYPPFKGGVANTYGNFVKYWNDKDSIFVLHNNDNELINNKLPVLKWLPAIFKLRKTIKEEKIDHVMVGNILPLGTAAFIISKFTKIKYSVVLHGMDLTFSFKKKRKKILAKKILKKAENILCMNSYVAEIAKETICKKNREKIRVVNPGIEKKSLTDKYASREDLIKKYGLQNKIILFSIGRLVKRKGHDNILKTLPRMSGEIPNLVYVVAGIGPDEEYLKKINYESHNKNVIFLGKITDEEKWAWLSLCDMFIMPSREIEGDFEGFGIVYMEASLSGSPIIAGDSGGVRDAVVNNETGLLVDPENSDEIKNAIIKLAKDKDLREKLGKQGRERAINEFNWEKQVDKIYNIINKKAGINTD